MTASEEFWDALCPRAPYFFAMLAVVAAMAALNLFVMTLGEQSEGTAVVSVLVFAILGVTGLGLTAVLWRCNRRD